MAGDGGGTMSALPDLVYVVRSGKNEELRYSLRSVEKHAQGLYGNVWVVGTGLPDWLTNVNVLPVHDLNDKHETMRRKIRAVCDEVGLADSFLLLNDDYFLTKPVKEWVVYHMGSASAWLKKRSEAVGGWSAYLRDVWLTVEWMRLNGYGDVLIRETHSPTWWDKSKLAVVLDEYPVGRGLTVVDLYDAAGCGGVGEYALNAKIHNDGMFDTKLQANDSPWMSSSDISFKRGRVGAYIRGLFPDSSRFEV